MSTLLSISREMLAELYPRTLYDFAQHLNTYESDFSIEENEKLAQLPPSLETFDDSQADLNEELKQYREKMMDLIRKVEINNSNSDSNAAVLILLHDLRKCATDDLVNELHQRSDVYYSAGYPNLEYVVRVLLREKTRKGEDLIRIVVQNANRSISRGFHYYVMNKGGLPFKHEELTPGHGLEEALVSEIRAKVHEKYATEICIVRIEEAGEKWFIEIIHGGKKQRTETERKAKATDTLIQPLETDSIVYNTRTKDIKIHMAKRLLRTERDVYVPALAKCLSNDLRTWKSAAKFDLERFRLQKESLQDLLDSAGKAISSPEIGNVRVLITEVGFTETVETDSKRHTSVLNKRSCPEDGLCCTLKSGAYLLAPAYALEYVILSVRYGVAKPRKSRVVVTRTSLSECPLNSVEDWLEEIGVSQIPDVVERS